MRAPNPVAPHRRSPVPRNGTVRRSSAIAQFAVSIAPRRIQGVINRARACRGADGRLRRWRLDRQFCRSMGIAFPQLTVLGTVGAHCAGPRDPRGRSVVPRHRDPPPRGRGYTVAHGGSFLHSLTPDTLRYARKFWPAFCQGHDSIRVRLGAAFSTRCASLDLDMDEVSPFERQRMLHPEPECRVLGQMQAALRAAFRKCSPRTSWKPGAESSRRRPTCFR
jgi:hypothetical protein